MSGTEDKEDTSEWNRLPFKYPSVTTAKEVIRFLAQFPPDWIVDGYEHWRFEGIEVRKPGNQGG